jgi:hypothetical protein
VVSVLSSFQSCWAVQLLEIAAKVLRYFKGTIEIGIHFNGNNQDLYSFSDADFAGDSESRRSSTEYLFLLCGGPISWVSRLQPTVAQSTCEAEYISAAAKGAIWLKYLFQCIEPVVVEHPILMAVDNQSASALIEHPASHQRSKHIDVQYHFVRQS